MLSFDSRCGVRRANVLLQTLEDMDVAFGDTEAHEEKDRIRQIEAQLRGVQIDGRDLEKGGVVTVQHQE
jgi:hypothetical protein